MKNVKNEGKTIILITKNVNESLNIADRVGIFNNQKLITVSSEVFKKSISESTFDLEI